MPSGASGFMSNESMWLSPPLMKTMIIDRARGTPRDAAPALPAGRQEPRQPQPEKAREPDLEELATRNPHGMAV